MRLILPRAGSFQNIPLRLEHRAGLRKPRALPGAAICEIVRHDSEEASPMPPVKVDPDRVREFADAEAFHGWLRAHHASEPEVWIRTYKLRSGIPSITPTEAIDVALCWGWIDAIRKGLDEVSYLQRYVPRGRKSLWSRINVENVARLIAEGRMTEHGLAHVEAAKADGRWARAYGGRRDTAIPDDLMAAIEADPAARATFATLNALNRFALAFRVNNMKTEAGRKKKIAAFVETLRRGESVVPQRRG
jgi:uncharacterized protein YdeI (YjbR/CyaY-like superfamily)